MQVQMQCCKTNITADCLLYIGALEDQISIPAWSQVQ
jgi:hypothetical protein